MADITQAKLEAAGKIAVGAGRVISGIAMGTGHGLLGAFFRSHGHMMAAQRIAMSSVEAGSATFREGLADWKDANS